MITLSTEERSDLRDVARRLAGDRFTIGDLRRLRHEENPTGWVRARWMEMAELGWTGLLIPEELGGSGGSLADMGVVLEELGRRLAVTPLVPSAVVVPALLLEAGTAAQRQDLLPAVGGGASCVALAIEETARFTPQRVASRAQPVRGGFRITGEKQHVVAGPVADRFLLSARTGGELTDWAGISLFLIDAGAPGVEVRPGTLLDSQPVASVRLTGVEVGRDACLGGIGDGWPWLEYGLDLAAIAVATEMLGGADQAFELTMAYLKEREQFGVVIGAFQALQHRAAKLYCDLELARGLVERALDAPPQPGGDLSRLASAAKAAVSATGLTVAEEGVQLHGGIGMTDEADIGFYLKRARVAELLFGDAGYHRDRFGVLAGY